MGTLDAQGVIEVDVALPVVRGAPARRTLGGPAYAAGVTRDALVLIEVGTVLGGLPCDETQSIDAWGSAPAAQKRLYLVPRAAAQVFPGATPEAVFAECSGS